MKLATVRRHALSLPEVIEEPHFHLTSFRVRGKIFCTADVEGTFVHLFVPELDRELALALHPGFLEKLLWGNSVKGLRAFLDKADAAVIKDLLDKAWRYKAPKTLVKAFDT